MNFVTSKFTFITAVKPIVRPKTAFQEWMPLVKSNVLSGMRQSVEIENIGVVKCQITMCAHPLGTLPFLEERPGWFQKLHLAIDMLVPPDMPE